MAGLAKGYDVTAIHQGSGDIWIIVAGIPADGAIPQLTLVAGTPDATTHAGSICLGTTESGIDFTLKQKFSDVKIDQADAPVDRIVDETDGMIEAELSQQSVDLLQQALSTGVYTAASGYKQITFGGTYIVPSVCVAAISPKRTGSSLYLVSMLFKANSEGGLQVAMKKSKKGTHKVQFKGLADMARTAGRQIGVHYETLT